MLRGSLLLPRIRVGYGAPRMPKRPIKQQSNHSWAVYHIRGTPAPIRRHRP
jgi:hypothetical protein